LTRFILNKYIYYLKKNDVIIYSDIDVELLNKYLKKDKIIYLGILITLISKIYFIPIPFKRSFLKYINNILIIFQRE